MGASSPCSEPQMLQVSLSSEEGDTGIARVVGLPDMLIRMADAFLPAIMVKQGSPAKDVLCSW